MSFLGLQRENYFLRYHFNQLKNTIRCEKANRQKCVSYQDCESTALILAATGGHTDVVQNLVNHGANVNTQNLEGRSALMIAAMSGRREIVRELIEAEADLDLENKEGKTAVVLAYECAGTGKIDPEIIRYGHSQNNFKEIFKHIQKYNYVFMFIFEIFRTLLWR